MKSDDYKCGAKVIRCNSRSEWDTLQDLLEKAGLNFFIKERTDDICDRYSFPLCVINRGVSSLGFDSEDYFIGEGKSIMDFSECETDEVVISNFLGGKVAINCKTGAECEKFMVWIHKNTSETWLGDVYDQYGSDTCYNFEDPNDLCYCDLGYYVRNEFRIVSCDEFFGILPEPKPEPKVYGIRNKETGEMFIGRQGVQSLWEKPGSIKASFYQRKGISFNNQQEWELVTYNCVEVI